MADLTRRRMLAGMAGSAASLTLAACSSTPTAASGAASPAPASDRIHGNTIVRENRHAGTTDWLRTNPKFKPNIDPKPVISAFASKTSVKAGETLDFFVSTATPQPYTVTVYRLGYYGGTGGRQVHSGPTLAGVKQADPTVSVLGTVRCPWERSWSLTIPDSWTPGTYLAAFVTDNGTRGFVPFMVRGDRRASMLLVLPFACYQAYNQYPFDGVLGKNLYYGFVKPNSPSINQKAPDGSKYPAKPDGKYGFWLHYPARARSVSFQRPYANDGIPADFDISVSFIRWAESEGFDLDYASNLDLANGNIDTSRYRTVILTGHDEYWSEPMRTPLEKSVSAGVNLVSLAANTMYWHTRNTVGPDGFPEITCYKTDPDPHPDSSGPTNVWRWIGGRGVRSEQRLLGTMYNGVVENPLPLIVAEPTHWMWAGSGVTAGEAIPGVLRGEADGVIWWGGKPAGAQGYTLLSASPYLHRKDRTIQSTCIYQAPSGAWVFNAGTFGWTGALDDSNGRRDPRIVRATTNLMRKLGN
jgi:hypothetical protein